MAVAAAVVEQQAEEVEQAVEQPVAPAALERTAVAQAAEPAQGDS